jgi:predicted methyltransferase
MVVLSGRQADAILSARGAVLGEVSVSLDLGRSTGVVKISGDRVSFPDGQILDISLIRKIEGDYCFLVRDSQLFRIQLFSPETRKTYTLVPTETAPTLSISGIRMHQTKDFSPTEDAAMKVRLLKPMKGKVVLDTCMGLGYSAIAAVKAGALHVTTIEADPNVIELAKVNPWSRELWEDNRIKRIEGDALDVVAGFEDKQFDRIIHDPPRVRMAGELYGSEFYSQLHRILKPKGILFHYVGRPGGRFRNRKTAKGVIERLRDAGFTLIKKAEEQQGVRAVK